MFAAVRPLAGMVERVVVEVAVETDGVDVAVVDVPGHREVPARAVARREREKRRAVVRDVGLGVHAGVVAGEEALLLQTVAVERIVRVRRGDAEIARRAFPAERAEHLAHVRGRVVAPAVLPEEIPGEIPVESGGVRAAVLELDRAPHVAAVDRLHGRARVAAAVLGLDRQGAPERVEAEQRIRSRHQRGGRDGDARDQVPAHDVAEWLVEPHAVHVDGETLRRAEERRCRIPAEVDVRLKRIALHLVDVHAAQAPVQEIGEVERAAFLDVAIDRRLDRRGNFVERKTDAWKRGGGDYLDFEHRRARRIALRSLRQCQ